MSQDTPVKVYLRVPGATKRDRASLLMIASLNMNMIPTRGESVDVTSYLHEKSIPARIFDQINNEPLYVDHVHTAYEEGREILLITVSIYERRPLFAY